MQKCCYSNLVNIARLGLINFLKDADQNANTITVSIIERILHPGYINSQDFNNIGLLKLDRLIEFSPIVRPACLPTFPIQP